MKTAIVTGGTGFIGKWLIDELCKNGVEVIALVRKIPEEHITFDHCPGRVNYIEYYSSEYESFCDSGKADVFYHLAWGGVAPEEKNNSNLQVENIRFSLEMLELASKLKVNKFIATGTVAEYSFCEDVMDVNAKQTPNDMYGAAKTAAHYMLETRARQLEIPFIWSVLPSTYGEGRRDSNILTYTIQTLLKGEKPRYGYLTQMWDFLYVGEVVRALFLIGEKGNVGKTYGIGSGIYMPIKEYVCIIRDEINPQLELGIGDIPQLSDKAFSSCVNISELTKDTGFVPEILFEDGIRKTIDYYRAELK